MRTLKQIYPALRDDIADLQTRRPLPGPGLQQVDPFLFLNHHGPQVYGPNNRGLPFGPHPHRGFETVTFILKGNLAHHDTGGHESVIEAGGVQWMTAGSGLIHSEVSPAAFKKAGGDLEILQLWVNLPAKLKMHAPQYTGAQAEQIPTVEIAGGKGRLNLISGTFNDPGGRAAAAGSLTGPIESLTGIFMSTLTLDAGATVILPSPRARSVFLYLVSGKAQIDARDVPKYSLVTLNHDGDEFEITALEACTFLFGHADVIGEAVVSHGPFVMNTRQEIIEAIQDYEDGKFG